MHRAIYTPYGANFTRVVRFPTHMEQILHASCDSHLIWSGFRACRAIPNTYGAIFSRVVRFPTHMERILHASCDSHLIWSGFRARRAVYNTYGAKSTRVERISHVSRYIRSETNFTRARNVFGMHIPSRDPYVKQYSFSQA